MTEYADNPKREDERVDLARQFIDAERGLSEARLKYEALSAEIEKRYDEVRGLRNQIGEAFGLSSSVEANAKPSYQ